MVLFFRDENKAALECLLFIAAEPLTIERLSQLLGNDEETLKVLLKELQEEHQKPHRGIEIEQLGGGYRMVTKPQYISIVEKLYKPQVNPLSQAALETLAIIAYRQPATKAEVEAVRGVSADSVIGTLVERGLITEKGRKEGIGRPILYVTTDKFLEYIGLNALQQLPVVEGLSEKEGE